MKLKIKQTPEQVELIQAMTSDNKATAIEAQEAFAAFIQPVVAQVLNQLGTAPLIYTDFTYNEDDSPTIPLDLWYAQPVGTITVWQQNMAGGMPSSLVSGLSELVISTYRLDSAVSFLKKYARRARLDVVSAGINRMLQEVLVKCERNAWAVILKALGEASTNSTKHTIASTTQNVLQLDDFNRLMTLNRRLNVSFAGGTPDGEFSQGVTDIFFSPEMMEQIRGFAYQPMNTRAGGASTTGLIAAPESLREEIFRNAGTPTIFNIGLHQLNELGTTQKYNVLFGTFAQNGIANGGGNFAAATDEIVIGYDASSEVFLRPLAQNADSGATFVAQPDDQFQTSRSEKVGFYGKLEEGRICRDARGVVGVVV